MILGFDLGTIYVPTYRLHVIHKNYSTVHTDKYVCYAHNFWRIFSTNSKVLYVNVVQNGEFFGKLKE